MINDTEKKEYEKFLKKVNNAPLLSNKQVIDMDFYELLYYYQTLNMIDGLEGNLKKETGK